MLTSLFILLAGAVTVFGFGAAGGAWRETAVWLCGATALGVILREALARRASVFAADAERARDPWLGAAFGLLIAAVLYGGLAWANAVSDHSLTTWQFTETNAAFWPDGPGSLAKSSTAREALEATVLGLIFLAAVIARRRSERAAFGFAAVFTALGVAVVVTAVVHKAIGAEGVYGMKFPNGEAHPPTFFAPFIYNANAGAFLNMLVPVATAAWLAARETERRAAVLPAPLWALAACVLAAGVVITASKAAVAILAVGAVVHLILQRRALRAVLAETSWRSGTAAERWALVALVAVAGIVVVFLGLQLTLDRFDDFFSGGGGHGKLDAALASGTLQGRLTMDGVLLDMASPEAAGWRGYGPGAFPHLFPYFAHEVADAIPGRWIHAHNDWLQLVVEWGYLGAALWGAFIAAALISALRSLSARRRPRRRQTTPSRPDRILTRGILAGLATVAIHAAVDFPLQIFSIEALAIALLGLAAGAGGKIGDRRSDMGYGIWDELSQRITVRGEAPARRRQRKR